MTDEHSKPQCYQLSDLGILRIAGIDTVKFLQGQLTCDVTQINSTQSVFTALCNPQGRVIATFWLTNDNNNYYIIAPRMMIAIINKVLKKFVVFFKVAMQDVSEELMVFGLTNVTINQTRALTLSISVSDTLLMVIQPNHQHDDLSQLNINSTDLPLCEWYVMLIAANIPLIYPENSSLFLPHDLNLHTTNAISFTKGCYTGQEIISRMHYKSKLKYHLFQGILDEACTLDLTSAIYQLNDSTNLQLGHLVNAVASDQATYLLFTLLKDYQDNQLMVEQHHLTILNSSERMPHA